MPRRPPCSYRSANSPRIMSKDAPEPEVESVETVEPAESVESAETDAVAAVAALEAQVADLKEGVARARADYANLQARTQREAALERDRVKARVLEGFLQVYEYGRMAAAEAEKTPGPLAEGIKMVVREFDRLLELEGVSVIGTVGEAFDSTLHEAVATEPADGVEAGAVSKIVTPGYRLGERVLRYARVAVAPDEE